MPLRKLLVHIARTGGTSVAIGLVFASIYAVGRPEAAAQILALGALTGICIALVIALLESLFDPHIERLGPRTRLVTKSILYIVGGTAGWIAGMLVGSRLFGVGVRLEQLLSGAGPLMITLVAGIALAVGLAFYAYELLQRRLERTIEQLKQREWAEKELELARSIQTRLLPPALIEAEGYTIAAKNLPAQFVAGDFYDVVRLDDGSIVIVVADVAGKGVGASLIMASVKAVLPFVARERAERAMAMLNEKLVHELGRREFVALAYARLQPNDGSLEVLNAGFPEPYIVSASGVRAIATSGVRLPLGVKADVAYEPTRTTLARGERLVFVSDGIPEAPVQGEPLGYERLAAMLANVHANGAMPWLDAFLASVREQVDDGLADDWTAVVVARG